VFTFSQGQIASHGREVIMGLPKVVNDALDRVIRRAIDDRDFRQRLLAEPLAAGGEVVGGVPKGVRLRFIEKPPDLDALIVLPDAASAAELNEQELDYAAGGEGEE
jgi:hypothetical protein